MTDMDTLLVVLSTYHPINVTSGPLELDFILNSQALISGGCKSCDILCSDHIDQRNVNSTWSLNIMIFLKH